MSNDKSISAFVSYASEDYFFVELAKIKLNEFGIDAVFDTHGLSSGENWREGIDSLVQECDVVVLVGSAKSVNATYVTYEWSYALGCGKQVIPIKIEDCSFHSRIELIQYLDFSKKSSFPWSSLAESIRTLSIKKSPKSNPALADSMALILSYMRQKNAKQISVDRLRKHFGVLCTDKYIQYLIQSYPQVFGSCDFKDGLGIKLLPEAVRNE